jgi:hypothetical protein
MLQEWVAAINTRTNSVRESAQAKRPSRRLRSAVLAPQHDRAHAAAYFDSAWRSISFSAAEFMQ